MIKPVWNLPTSLHLCFYLSIAQTRNSSSVEDLLCAQVQAECFPRWLYRPFQGSHQADIISVLQMKNLRLEARDSNLALLPDLATKRQQLSERA